MKALRKDWFCCADARGADYAAISVSVCCCLLKARNPVLILKSRSFIH